MADAAARPFSRLSSTRWLVLMAGVVLAIGVAGVVVTVLALGRLSDARTRVVDRIDPARIAARSLLVAYLDQETAVRGYVLTAQDQFLAPYALGQRDARPLRARLGQLAGQDAGTGLTGDLRDIDRRAATWTTGYAGPAITATRQGVDPPPAQAGKQLFDALRDAFDRLEAHQVAVRADGRATLRSAAREVEIVAIMAGGLLVLGVLALALALRRVVTRPLDRLGDDARRVASGDFEHVVQRQGPRDIAELAGDVDAMRERIIAELRAVQDARARLEEQAVDLQRSNAELEQFAYVASHDLQEPLRKVASFCGLLKTRYGGQLDERADQYIDFAVDGAKRMQILINDLLAFSRVGRAGIASHPVAMNVAASDAVSNLGPAIQEAGATVEVGELPVVNGDRSLLATLLQNLIGNALKFRGDDPPQVVVSVRTDGEMYVFAVDDNGIGIAERHAERIFVIFQRLHTKEEFSGTGIGLALCRKIVEHHGGRIWLEAHDGPGAHFRFSLPRPKDPEPA